MTAPGGADHRISEGATQPGDPPMPKTHPPSPRHPKRTRPGSQASRRKSVRPAARGTEGATKKSVHPSASEGAPVMSKRKGNAAVAAPPAQAEQAPASAETLDDDFEADTPAIGP